MKENELFNDEKGDRSYERAEGRLVEEAEYENLMFNMNKKKHSYEIKLKKSREQYAQVAQKLNLTRQLERKALFELNDMKKESDLFDERLKEIQNNYLSCVETMNHRHRHCSDDAAARTKINELAEQRDKLKEELNELERSANEDDKKIAYLNMQITIERKKNAALLRKLRKATLVRSTIPQSLKGKIDAILDDPIVKEETKEKAEKNEF